MDQGLEHAFDPPQTQSDLDKPDNDRDSGLDLDTSFHVEVICKEEVVTENNNTSYVSIVFDVTDDEDGADTACSSCTKVAPSVVPETNYTAVLPPGENKSTAEDSRAAKIPRVSGKSSHTSVPGDQGYLFPLVKDNEANMWDVPNRLHVNDSGGKKVTNHQTEAHSDERSKTASGQRSKAGSDQGSKAGSDERSKAESNQRQEKSVFSVRKRRASRRVTAPPLPPLTTTTSPDTGWGQDQVAGGSIGSTLHKNSHQTLADQDIVWDQAQLSPVYNRSREARLVTLKVSQYGSVILSLTCIAKQLCGDLCYQCPYCGHLEHAAEGSMGQHLIQHLHLMAEDPDWNSRKKPGLKVMLLKCCHCDFVTHHSMSLVRHFQNHHGYLGPKMPVMTYGELLKGRADRVTECSKSGVFSVTTRTDIVACGMCDYRTRMPDLLVYHVTQSHPLTGEWGQEMKLGWFSSSSVSGDKQNFFICTTCYSAFTTLAAVENHVWAEHFVDGRFIFMCDQCMSCSQVAMTMERHVKEMHGKVGQLSCTVSLNGDFLLKVGHITQESIETLLNPPASLLHTSIEKSLDMSRRENDVFCDTSLTAELSETLDVRKGKPCRPTRHNTPDGEGETRGSTTKSVLNGTRNSSALSTPDIPDGSCHGHSDRLVKKCRPAAPCTGNGRVPPGGLVKKRKRGRPKGSSKVSSRKRRHHDTTLNTGLDTTQNTGLDTTQNTGLDTTQNTGSSGHVSSEDKISSSIMFDSDVLKPVSESERSPKSTVTASTSKCVVLPVETHSRKTSYYAGSFGDVLHNARDSDDVFCSSQAMPGMTQGKIIESGHMPSYLQTMTGMTQGKIIESGHMPSYLQTMTGTTQGKIIESGHMPSYLQTMTGTTQGIYRDANDISNSSQAMVEGANTDAEDISSQAMVEGIMTGGVESINQSTAVQLVSLHVPGRASQSLTCVAKVLNEVQRFQCPYCGFEHTSGLVVTEHIAEHIPYLDDNPLLNVNTNKSDVLLVFCSHCDFVTHHLMSLVKHFQGCHGYRGPVMARIDPRDVLFGHKRRSVTLDRKEYYQIERDGEVHYSCRHCRYRVTSPQALLWHMDMLHGGQPEVRDALDHGWAVCDHAVMNSESCVSAHQLMAPPVPLEEVFVCTTCYYLTQTLASAQSHCWEKHYSDGRFTFSCTQCQFSVQGLVTMVTHVRAAHPEGELLHSNVSLNVAFLQDLGQIDVPRDG